ncbi:MAG: hypothetical protein M3O15_01250 [Acidobacteriota bacterium]|nr:hypothetical protein [Acidobacteriota bacterium]
MPIWSRLPRFRPALPPVLCLLASIASSLPSARAVEPPPGTRQQSQTITDIRGVGTAMFHWYKDTLAAQRSKATHEEAEEQAQAATVDVTRIPVIGREELAKLLVPKYLAAIPENDGWGHPYEFRLATANLEAVRVMAVRSAGADGTFSGTTYEVGAFPLADQGQDLVWVDGYFARWPGKAESTGK